MLLAPRFEQYVRVFTTSVVGRLLCIFYFLLSFNRFNQQQCGFGPYFSFFVLGRGTKGPTLIVLSATRARQLLTLSSTILLKVLFVPRPGPGREDHMRFSTGAPINTHPLGTVTYLSLFLLNVTFHTCILLSGPLYFFYVPSESVTMGPAVGSGIFTLPIYLAMYLVRGKRVTAYILMR